MRFPKRPTACFEADVHRALRLKAAVPDRTISDIVNDARNLRDTLIAIA